MIFEIVFHTPFRVSSGQAGDGSDTTVDRAALLPASSLKGVMLSAARDLLKFPRSARPRSRRATRGPVPGHRRTFGYLRENPART